VPPLRQTALLCCAALVAALAVAPGAPAAVILAPAEGGTAVIDDTLTTGDGRVITPRRNGESLLVRADEGFAVQERREAGRLVALAVSFNGVDRLSVSATGTLHLNGAEWNAQSNVRYLLPNGGTIDVGPIFPEGEEPPPERRTRFPLTITSMWGDRLVIGDEQTPYPYPTSLRARFDVAGGLTAEKIRLGSPTTRLDGQVDGLLRADAGASAGDDLTDREGRPTDLFGALDAWALDPRESLFADSPATICRASVAGAAGHTFADGGFGDVRATRAAGSVLGGGGLLGLPGVERSTPPDEPLETRGCTFEDEGRELVAAIRTSGPVRAFVPTYAGPGVLALRKTYVSRGPVPFVRHLVVLRNTSDRPVSTTLLQRFAAPDGTAQVVTGTSSGAEAASAEDSWLTASADDAQGERPDLGLYATGVVWQDAVVARDRADAVYDQADVAPPDDPTTVSPAPGPFATGDRSLAVAFGDVQLAAREQATFLIAQVLAERTEDAREHAAALAAAPDALFAGLSERERRGLRNWRPPGDRDADGHGHPEDRCPDAPAATEDGCPPPAPAPTPSPRVETVTRTVPVPVPFAAPRLAPRGLAAAAARRGPRAVRVGARLTPPAGAACGGLVKVTVRPIAGGRPVTRHLALPRSCRAAATVALPARWARRRVEVRVRFLGSERLAPVAAQPVQVAAPRRR
jgi:hypothetical protein